MEKPQVQGQQQIQVELGEKEAEGIYSNVVFIAHSQSEVILDFARALPGLAKAKVYARVIVTPPARQVAAHRARAEPQELRDPVRRDQASG